MLCVGVYPVSKDDRPCPPHSSCHCSQLRAFAVQMTDVPQSDVSRPSALPTASLLQRNSHPTIDQNSNEYLDAVEEEWNKKVDVEIDTLVDGMVDLVGLASVSSIYRVFFYVRYMSDCSCYHEDWRQGQISCRSRGVSGAMSG